MKSVTTRIAFSALTIVAFAACGGGDNSAATTSADSSTAVTPPAATTTDSSAGAPAATGALPAGVTAEMVAAGETAFKSGPCIACHGADAKGTAMAPDLTDDKWINIDGSYDAIKTTIKNGVPTPKEHPAAMPPMGGAQLTDDQIAQIGAYVYSLSHKG